MRTCVPILRVKPHTTKASKETIIPETLNEINVDKEP